MNFDVQQEGIFTGSEKNSFVKETAPNGLKEPNRFSPIPISENDFKKLYSIADFNDKEFLSLLKTIGISLNSGNVLLDVAGKKIVMSTDKNDFGVEIMGGVEKIQKEEKISFLLNSPNTIEQINRFPDESREVIVGEILKFLIIFQDDLNPNDLEKYLIELNGFNNLSPDSFNFKKRNVELLIKFVAHKLNLLDLNSYESKKAIYEYFTNNCEKNGYYFHSFNGAFEESINKNGLNVQERMWDAEELNHINNIFKRVGLLMVFGWADINCDKKLSIADETKNVYHYGIASPEWFSQFISGPHMPSLCDKKAFYTRNYDSAKNNILMFCKSLMSRSEEDIKAKKSYPNITIEEEVEILNFFEKSWKIFAGEKSIPKCALIKNSSIEKDYSESYDDFLNRKIFNSFEDIIDYIVSSKEHDTQIEENINTRELVIVDLPQYSKIHKE